MPTTTRPRRRALPWTWRRALAMLTPPAREKTLTRALTVPGVLSAREAIARHLFGEQARWAPSQMLDYDHSPMLQGAWGAEADRHLEHRNSPDRFIAAHHGYSDAAWMSLPAIRKLDLREAFYEDKGMAS